MIYDTRLRGSLANSICI